MINNEWSERESVKLSNVIMEQMMNRGLTLEVLEKATENVKSVFYTDAIVKKGWHKPALEINPYDKSYNRNNNHRNP